MRADRQQSESSEQQRSLFNLHLDLLGKNRRQCSKVIFLKVLLLTMLLRARREGFAAAAQGPFANMRKRAASPGCRPPARGLDTPSRAQRLRIKGTGGRAARANAEAAQPPF